MELLLKIKSMLKKRLGVPSIAQGMERLSAVGFRPELIFDVGAYHGDFAKMCHKLWPEAKIVCFEPQESKIPILQNCASEIPSLQVFQILLGAQVLNSVAFNEAETASSVLIEHIPQNFPVKHYDMTTIDNVVEKHFGGQSPAFLKLDTQGYELEILKGAQKSLAGIEIILVEVNLLDIHQNVPLLAEITQWLHEKGWAAYDICDLTRRPLDHALWQADFIFVPYTSIFRADKRWKA
jgi:FkbM family methyltransferase